MNAIDVSDSNKRYRSYLFSYEWNLYIEKILLKTTELQYKTTSLIQAERGQAFTRHKSHVFVEASPLVPT